MEFTPAYFNQLVINRRSVFPKQFDTTKKVPDDIVKQIVLNATWAPNHGQAEPWFFKIFTGKGLHTFAAIQSRIYKESAGELYNNDKLLKLQLQPLLASHIISIGMKRTPGGQIPEIEDIEAVACAVQNMYLSVAAYGLGGYWTTGGITYLDKAKYHFGLAAPDKLLGFFYIGHVAIPSSTGKRKPIEEKVEWVTV
ncbi:MAG: nitroreductase [Ferruginibacter sp.]|nr:nitroreductase [Ferruginibacter sp.]